MTTNIVVRRAGIIAATLLCGGVLASIERAPERHLADQPFPDSAEYASSARSLAQGNGFFTYVHGNSRQPPRYPPGYPMVLSPFAAVGSFPHDVQRGAKFWAMAYVLAVMLAAWVLGGPLAGALSASFLAISPFARDSAGLVLSDAFVAALTVAMLPLLRPPTRSGARLAGGLCGFAVLARVTAGVNLIALLAALPRRLYRPMLAFVLPSLVVLGLLQWALFGNPFESGYSYWGVAHHMFDLSYASSESVVHGGPWIFADKLKGSLASWACPCSLGGPQSSLPNLAFYPLLMFGVFWVFAPPLIPLLGLFYAWHIRREAIGRYALAVVVISLIVFSAYRFQETRFMAGPATVLTVLASVWLAQSAARLVRRWPTATRRRRRSTQAARLTRSG